MAWIELEAEDGHMLHAGCVRPVGEARRAVVVLQEIFGVSGPIRSVCERWVAEGSTAIAPARYDRVRRGIETGYDPQVIADGRAAKERLGDETAWKDVQAALDFARYEAPQVAVIGFCWGGPLAWLAASRLDGVDAAIACCGTDIAGYLGERPTVPVLLHFGEQDTHIPPQQVREIEQAWPGAVVHRYPARRGFNCDERPSFHSASTELAAKRTREFLKENLPC